MRVLADEHVLGLDVIVHDALIVQGGDDLRQLDQHADAVELLAGMDEGEDGRSSDVLHGEGRPTLDLPQLRRQW